MEKSCKTCKHNVEYPPAHTCDECDSLANPDYYMWEAKEETQVIQPSIGEYYVKLVCKVLGEEIVVSEVKFEDFIINMSKDLSESILENLEESNVKQ